MSGNYAALSRARAELARQKDELATVEVQLQVRDLAHAKSPEVISFATDHLVRGGTWAELRRLLGLGPSHLDKRWRAIREIVTGGLIPQSEDEALQAQGSMRNYLLGKLEDFMGDIEGIMLTMTDDKLDRGVMPAYMKIKLDALKALLEENNKSYENWLELHKARKADLKTQGPSIIIQNNYHIPRPGDTPREIQDVTKKVTSLIDAAKNVR